ncbi:MAG: NUDIX hydrolase [Deltaproteobacteria bacterium]|nr:NUDIX hydrolase [Deltaproteobacteria bacterium]
MRRAYPERPLVGVAAVILRDREVLLVQRGKMPGKGEWSLPGGLIELGETIQEALHREIREELSVKIEILGLVGVYDKIVKDVNNNIQYHYIIVDYCAQITSGIPRAESDAAAVKWVSQDALKKFTADDQLREAVSKAFAL